MLWIVTRQFIYFRSDLFTGGGYHMLSQFCRSEERRVVKEYRIRVAAAHYIINSRANK